MQALIRFYTDVNMGLSFCWRCPSKHALLSSMSRTLKQDILLEMTFFLNLILAKASYEFYIQSFHFWRCLVTSKVMTKRFSREYLFNAFRRRILQNKSISFPRTSAFLRSTPLMNGWFILISSTQGLVNLHMSHNWAGFIITLGVTARLFVEKDGCFSLA